MKILYIITKAEKGGAQVHLLDLIREFKDRSEVEIAVGEKGFLYSESVNLGVKTHYIPELVQAISPIKDAKALIKLIRLISCTKPDIVHTHSSKAGTLGRMAAYILRKRFVFTAHGWAFTEGAPRIQSWLGLLSEKFISHLGGHTITVSQHDYDLALKKVKGKYKSLVVIHNGISDTPIRRNRGQDRVVRIIMIARFSPQKDHLTLIKAVSKINGVELTLVGCGKLESDMIKLSDKLGISDRVHFLGERNDIHELLIKQDIFVLSSNYEGFPISILEAMRAGLPVIATDVGGVREAVIDGVSGYLFNAGDTYHLIRLLERLVEDPSKREHFGDNGRLRFVNNFTQEIMFDKIWSVYTDAQACD